jgi:hypothetical protein
LSAEDVAGGSGGPGGPAGAPGQPTEEELRAAYEAELSRITTTDMMAQAAVSLLNLGAQRLAPAGEGGPGQPQRDLEQARDAIDGVKALLEILERTIASELGPLRDALSRLQMAYAREMQLGSGPAPGPATAPAQPGGAAAQPPPAGPDAPQGQPGEPDTRPPGPGPAESSGRLWVPGR